MSCEIKKFHLVTWVLYGSDISDEMNKCLDDSWKKQYGLEITDVAMGDINLTEESMKRVSRIDDAKNILRS